MNRPFKDRSPASSVTVGSPSKAFQVVVLDLRPNIPILRGCELKIDIRLPEAAATLHRAI
jgi:hypothetical protein